MSPCGGESGRKKNETDSAKPGSFSGYEPSAAVQHQHEREDNEKTQEPPQCRTKRPQDPLQPHAQTQSPHPPEQGQARWFRLESPRREVPARGQKSEAGVSRLEALKEMAMRKKKIKARRRGRKTTFPQFVRANKALARRYGVKKASKMIVRKWKRLPKSRKA